MTIPQEEERTIAATVEVVVYEGGEASLCLFAGTPEGYLSADCECPEEGAGETLDLLLDLPADGTEDPTHV
jgi:hypothetical protein